MADKGNHVQVEIFGQTYSVKAGNDPAYVEKLAAYVDEEMKDVSRASGAVDSLRVAVLAALNLADECFRLRQEADSKHSSGAAQDERAMRLARKLGAALGE
jgi:cell division protein ZapA